MTAPRPREQADPPTDRLPSPRGGHPFPSTASAAARPAGFARLAGARRSLIGSARALAAAALLALSGGLALPATAEAQTCTLNTGDLWCGVVTVGELGSGDYGFVSISGTNVGDLTDNSGDRIFTSGTAQYAVYRVAVSSFGLSFAVTRTTADGVQSPGLHDDDRARLHLHVDGHSASFAFSDVALSGTLGYEWSGASLDWSSTGSVTVRLREVAALSSDATLSGLTVTGGGSELVTFVSGTTTYAASVVSTVAEVTVTPTTTDTGATIEYLDGDDATLTDAGTADGHQVALAVGDDTVIKVKVTAEDGNATQTYMVTVSRAAPTCTLNTGDGDIWCGVVTVEAYTSFGLTNTYGFVIAPLGAGALSDTGFSVGTNPYTIDYVTVNSTSGDLSFSLTSALTATDKEQLVLHVDSASFAFSDASFVDASDTYKWSGSGLDWSSEDYVTLRLREAAASTDATLSDLVVNDGTTDLTLTPTFASGKYTYTAMVVNTVTEVTVTPTPNDSGATIEYLDASDTTLDDADAGATGHQVAVAEGDTVIKVKVTAQDTTTTQTYMVTVTRAAAMTPTPGICDRTQQVQDAILAELEDVDDCAAVTVADLETVTELQMARKNVTALKSGDFAGLSALDELQLRQNSLTELPSDLFSGLTALMILNLSNNALESLPSDVFSGLTAMDNLSLGSNASLGAALPETVFSGLTSLRLLALGGIGLDTIPPGLFSGLSKLTTISLDGNRLVTLPAALFSGLAKLKTLLIADNRLGTLPAGLFSGLTELTELKLYGNATDPLPLTVTLEKVEDGQVRAKVLTGAPFAVDIPVTLVDGTLAGGATTLRVKAGSVEGEPLTVIRTGDTGDDVTVDLGTPLPSLPPKHQGYEYVKAASGLPVEVPDALEREPGVEGALRLTPDRGGPYTHDTDGSCGGISGRAEIFHAGRWGTVSSDGFSKGHDLQGHRGPGYERRPIGHLHVN